MTWASFDLTYGAKLAEQYQFGARSQHGGSCCSKAWCLCDRSGHWVLKEPVLRSEILPGWIDEHAGSWPPARCVSNVAQLSASSAARLQHLQKRS